MRLSAVVDAEERDFIRSMNVEILPLHDQALNGIPS